MGICNVLELLDRHLNRPSSLSRGAYILVGDFVVVTESCLTFYNPMDGSTPGSIVLHYLLEFPQTHVHRVDDAI